MSGEQFLIGFIGPGGPEFLVVMLVLLMMFGAKDAPRILRKINDIINQIRNTADGFKREVLYSDLTQDIYPEPATFEEEFDIDEEFQPLEEDEIENTDENEDEEKEKKESGDDVSKA
jgi:Sec-independent protein translocase protein TatA